MLRATKPISIELTSLRVTPVLPAVAKRLPARALSNAITQIATRAKSGAWAKVLVIEPI